MLPLQTAGSPQRLHSVLQLHWFQYYIFAHSLFSVWDFLSLNMNQNFKKCERFRTKIATF